MTKTVLLAGAAAFALSGVAYAGAAHPSLAGKSAFKITFPLKHAPKAACSQRDNDNGIGIVSQNFESSFDQYDAQGADDCTLKNDVTKVKGVIADGIYFNGSGPADSFDVVFYKNVKGKPGAAVKTCAGASYVDTGFGSPDVKCKAKLKKGKYFVSVVANMNFSVGGEWGWNTNNTVRGGNSQWQNPGGGFGTSCTSWDDTTTCIPSGEGGDFSFALH